MTDANFLWISQKILNPIDVQFSIMYIIVILKAIHNKDYSVVKTFRAALFRVSSSLFA